MKQHFADFDLTAFWHEYGKPPVELTDGMVEKAEKFLGYKLPVSYIALLKTKNGGCPINRCFPTTEAAISWAEDHIAISTIEGIGVRFGIDDEEGGSPYMINEWGYPDVGIVVCGCPSAGHDVVMLDYSDCGKNGEPKIIHVETETETGEPKVIVLAKDFETFIRGLVNDDEFDVDD